MIGGTESEFVLHFYLACYQYTADYSMVSRGMVKTAYLGICVSSAFDIMGSANGTRLQIKHCGTLVKEPNCIRGLIMLKLTDRRHKLY
jgi:hypothetical protein